VEFCIDSNSVAVSFGGYAPLEGIFLSASAPSQSLVYFQPSPHIVVTEPPTEALAPSYPSRGAILEMRPSHTPLEDLAGEETSELERDYPW
jgi:hypothetical protein